MKKIILATTILSSVVSFGTTNDAVDVRMLEKRIERIERKLELTSQLPTRAEYDEVSPEKEYSFITNFVFNYIKSIKNEEFKEKLKSEGKEQSFCQRWLVRDKDFKKFCDKRDAVLNRAGIFVYRPLQECGFPIDRKNEKPLLLDD